MSFMLNCPNCGRRFVGEFTFRGAYQPRPGQEQPFDRWVDYVYMQDNPRGKQVEWWYHAAGCRRWFLVKRDNTNNTDHVSFPFDDREPYLRKDKAQP